MKSKNLTFITIEPRNNTFTALLSVEDLLAMESDPEPILQKAVELYKHTVTAMRSLITEIQACKEHRKPIPASIMWKLGDSVFQLRDRLGTLSLQLDSTYAHLVRDLGVKREWLEKVIIFRRYLAEESLIPESLTWSRCRKGIRTAAERLREGMPLD